MDKISFPAAALTVFAIFITPLVERITVFERDGKHFLWLVLFVSLAFLYQKSISVFLKEYHKTVTVIAVLFSLSFTIGGELHRFLSIDGFFSIYGVFRFAICLSGYGVLFYSLITLLYHFIDKTKIIAIKADKWWFTDNHQSLFIVWVVIFLCWLPYLYIFYPGFFSPDSIRQFEMGLGIREFSAHHTILHTLIMTFFIRLGDKAGNLNTGAALYGLTQMIVMSLLFSFVIKYLASRKVHVKIRVLFFIYFAVYPVNALYSMTGWKDVIFGGLCLLLFILMAELFRNPDDVLSKKSSIFILCLVTILFGLFRNNAVYVLVLFTPFFLFFLRKNWKKVVPMAIVVLISITLFNVISFSIFNVKKTGAEEALSVPLQQIARTVTLHGDDLTPEEITRLSQFFAVEKLPGLYDPHISDPVKWSGFKPSAFHDDTGGFWAIWLSLGCKYPGAYISSFLLGSYGYWYPNVNEGIYTLWVYPEETLPSLRAQHRFPLRSGLLFVLIDGFARNLPVLSMLSSIGFNVWLIILSAGYLIIIKQKKMLVPLLIPALVWFTTLASPVYAEYRYVYGVILSAPVILVLMILEKNAIISNKNEKEKI